MMDGALGHLGQFGDPQKPLTQAPATNPLVNPSSMQPQAMSNMMGSPLANGGANMMPFMQMQEAFMPQEQANSSSAYASGGLVRFAEGGMPKVPPEGGAGGAGALNEMAAQGDMGAGQEGVNPELQAMVEQIFQEGLNDPEGIAPKLLELVKEEIAKVVSPEEMAYLQTPEGEHELQQIVQEIMSSSGMGAEGAEGGLGGMGGGEMPPGGGGALGAMAG